MFEPLQKSIGRGLLECRVALMRRRASSRSRTYRIATRLITLGRTEDADEILEKALPVHSGDTDLLDRYAMSALAAGRYEVALERWEDLRRADADVPMAWVGIAACLRELERLPSAAEEIRQAHRLFPDSAIVIDEANRVAEGLIDVQRFAEAEAILEALLARVPEHTDVLYLYALSGHQGGGFQTALTRWETLRRVDADHPMAWCGIAGNLRELGRLPPAEETIREALRRFPEDTFVAAEAARVFRQTGFHAEAVTQWQRLMAVGPANDEWFGGLAYSLALSGRVDEARDVLALAQEQFPDDRDLLETAALVEMACENWNGALAIWRVYRARYPDNQPGWEGQGKTLAAIQLARAESEHPDDAAVKVEIEAVEDEAMRSLMLGFESIGADCEFGLVQRRFSAEPLGLLRFNNVQLAHLLQALEAGFARMGEPDVTRMFTSVSGEFYVEDMRWHLGMHTFMFSSQYKAEDLLPKMHRRVAYLRDKMMADLRAGEKVFVFKTDGIDLGRLRELHGRLRTFGPVRLLHVRQASVPLTDEPLPVAPGQVFRIEPDLWVGFLGRMGNAQPLWDIAFDDWISICRGIGDAPPLPVVAQLVQALS